MRAQRTALVRITHGSPSQREASTPTVAALPRHLLAAPRECAACGTSRGALVRHFVEILLQARLSPRVGHKLPLKWQFLSSRRAHTAPRCCALRMAHPQRGRRELPPPLRGTSLKEGGKFYLAQTKSHFPHIRNKYVAKGVTALCLPAINHRYKQGFPAQYAPICRLRGFQEGVNAPSAIM